MPHALVAAYAIVVCWGPDGRFLLVRHQSRGWELPGGRLEPGEDGVAAAVREFREETGHGLVSAREILAQQKPNGLCHVVVGDWGPPVASKGSDEVVLEHRFVRRLSEVSPLAFPDDPYDEIERALGRRIR